MLKAEALSVGHQSYRWEYWEALNVAMPWLIGLAILAACGLLLWLSRRPKSGEPLAANYVVKLDADGCVAGFGVGACSVPPEGWACTRDADHDGPCAAVAVAEERDPHFGGSSYEASLLRHLLARIHGDGGHYVADHGLDAAVSDAEDLVAGWRGNDARWQRRAEVAEGSYDRAIERLAVMRRYVPARRRADFDADWKEVRKLRSPLAPEAKPA